MFEKEAEEWWNNEYSPSLYDNVSEVWQNGAEFGFNKANEWHDLRKDPNDLPKVNQKVLLQIKDKDEPITDFYTQNNIWNFANKYETIAWCEIPTYTEASE